MIDVILVSHGALAAGLREAAEMIMGEQENITVMGLYPGETREDFTDNLEKTIDTCKSPKNVLILADLKSGTPFNAAMVLALKKGVTCIAGANLAMLLEILSARDECGMNEIVKLASESGKQGIMDSETLRLQAQK